jgi:hypothetical protein
MSKLLLDQAISPPRLQVFACLDNVLLQLVSLRGNELLYTAEALPEIPAHRVIPSGGFRDCGLRRELGTPATAIRVVRIHLVDGDEVC